MPGLRAALGPDVAFEGESTLPLARIADHHLSWAQWFADSRVPGVIRARWFEQRHMLHHTRRWNRSHAEELHSAWLNGVGVLVWENVFGVVGRLERARPRAAARRWSRVQRRYARAADATASGRRSRRAATTCRSSARAGPTATTTLWALANRGDEPFAGDVRSAERRAWSCRRAASQPSSTGGRRDGRRRRLADVPGARGGARARRRSRASTRCRTGFVEVEPAPPLIARFRRRETGIYGEAPYVEEWKPLPPRLHDFVEVERDRRRAAASRSRVREEPRRRACRSPRRARTRPRAARGCRPRTSGSSPPRPACSSASQPARLELDRERALGRPHALRDPQGRLGIAQAEGSEWYVDGGPQPPEFSLQLLLAGGRCSARRASASGWRSTL